MKQIVPKHQVKNEGKIRVLQSFFLLLTVILVFFMPSYIFVKKEETFLTLSKLAAIVVSILSGLIVLGIGWYLSKDDKIEPPESGIIR